MQKAYTTVSGSTSTWPEPFERTYQSQSRRVSVHGSRATGNRLGAGKPVIWTRRAAVSQSRISGSRPWRRRVVTKADVPAELRASPFGPRLHAVVGLMGGLLRLAKREIKSVLDIEYGIRVILGSIPKMERRMKTALDAPYEAALYERVTSTQGELRTVLSKHAPEARILEKIAALYRAYYAYVVEVHLLIRDRGKQNEADAWPEYLDWEKKDEAAIGDLFETSARQPELSKLRDDVRAIGDTREVRL